MLSSLLLCGASALVPAPRPHVSAPPAGRLLVEQSTDGAIWARGDDYKLSFARDGARFRVRTGPARPTESLALAPPTASVGARALELAADVAPVLDGRTVTFARGDLVELWQLEPQGARQNFVLLAPPPAGDLVLRIPHAGELAPSAGAGPLAFRGPGGSEVRYGDWFAFDPLGRCAAGRPTSDGAAIEIRVPDAFLRAAQYPLWIDPLVSVATIVSSTHDVSDAEIANDDSLGVIATCYTDEFSKGDLDIVATRVTESGAFLSELPIEISDEFTLNPAIANHESANQFLVAWEDLGDQPYELSRIRARTIHANTGALGSVWSVHAGDACGFPAVGGSSSSSTGANYYVVWQERGLVPFLDPDVVGRTVNPSGSMGSRTVLDGRSSVQSLARISKRSGNGSRWMIVYTTDLANNVRSVDCAIVNTSGSVLLDKHSLSNGVYSVPDVDGDGTEFLTVMQSANSAGHGDIVGLRSTFTGGTPTTVGYALGFFELTASQYARDQRQPVVARTKNGFTYAYSEAPNSGSAADSIFAASILQTATPLTFTEKRVALGSGGAAKICNGLLEKRSFVLWQTLGVGTDELDMAVYDAP
ncbi:MAG: hypothetical protein EPO68_06730 [Planctomycetota bacterium]|nr:MAG: hypothetical protein EPO68_06730 [Planctomycetota bacterium]